MYLRRFLCVSLAACFSVYPQTSTISVGSGAPNGLQGRFISAYFRNNFNFLTSLPPFGDVKKLGTGLVQEFPDAAVTPGVKYALVRANTVSPQTVNVLDVLQMYPSLYTYYISLGTTAAGYPVTDTQSCPYLINQPGVTCLMQVMDKPAALFVFSNGNTYYTIDPFYTRWQALGGVVIAGAATSDQQTVTSTFKTTATLQSYDQAALFNITSGNLSGHMYAVGPNVIGVYLANNSYLGSLGFPTSDELIQADGSRRQNFEGGAITYVPGSPATLRYPVSSISIVPSTSLKMNLGDTVSVQANLADINGNALTGRSIVWSTSNSRIVTVQSTGNTATVKAVGGGGATIQATSEGKLSTPLAIFVNAPCCDVGAGSPSPSIQQAFQDAVTRNKLTLRLPVATPVQRIAGGYVQDVQDASGAAYLIAVADGSVAGYVIGGILLTQYNALGGPSGSAGYPTSDATAGGRQMFANQMALAGNPVQVVSGPFLSRWAALGYETGAAGSPASAVTTALSFRATTGQVQSFKGGAMFLATSGPTAGSVYFSGGLISAAYNQAGGITSLGFPAGDEFTTGGKRQQDFEGGFIDYTPGDTVAQVHPGKRQPIIQATPSTAVAGSRLRLAVGGFDSGSTVRVSVTGQPDFIVKTDNGAYVWDANVPSTAKAGTVQIHAADTGTGASADGSYIVRTAADVHYQLGKMSGDGQGGLPGAVLAQPLVVSLKDDSGNAAAGVAVTWAASPGAAIVAASTLTDVNGQAQALLRLQPNDGITLATATSVHLSTTFSAQAIHSGLTAFPAATGTPLLSSAAGVLRYYQNLGMLPTPNGFADATTLSQFLTGYCTFDAAGAQVCDGFYQTNPGNPQQFVNLWRLGAFVGGNLDVSIEKADLSTIRDFLAQGTPLILELASSSGPQYVVATGVQADGSISIMDPGATPKTNLNDYIGQGAAKLDQVIRLIPQASKTTGFLVTSSAALTISSPAGACGAPFVFNSTTGQPALVAIRCDGTQSQYQLDGSGVFSATVTDLGTPANVTPLTSQSGATLRIFQSAGVWTAAPQALAFTTSSVVNAASFTPNLAPGSLFSVFGSGMGLQPGSNSIAIGGVSAPILAQTAFQVNGQIPPSVLPGATTIKIVSPYGTVEQPLSIQQTAPAIFMIGVNQAAITNANGSLNTPDNPLSRGGVLVIYCTGLGVTSTQGQLHPATTPVTVTIGNSVLQPAFAGLTPGFVGLYQVNVQVPLSMPPGLNLSLSLQQTGSASNTASVSIQ